MSFLNENLLNFLMKFKAINFNPKIEKKRLQERDFNKIYRQLLPVVPIQLIIFQAVCYTCTLYHITRAAASILTRFDDT